MSQSLLQNPLVSERINLLSAWIESQMAYRGQPGLSIAIVHDQELVWARGFGCADREAGKPAATDTIYRIASITKTFTATAVMILRDAGKLQLDDPITRYLPWFQVKSEFEDAPPITIRHLVTHTSGLPREAAFPYWGDDCFPTREQIMATLPGQNAALPTETRWKYSNLAVALAGEVVSAVAGQPWEDFVQDAVLQPLGMQSTFTHTIDPAHPRLARGYSRRLPDLTRSFSPFTDSRGISPAANMATTVEDLARFAMLQFRSGPAGGSQILRGSSLREMQRIHWLQPNWQAGWGIGFRIERRGGKTYFGHGGAVKGYRTNLSISPAEKVAVVVFTNADDGLPAEYSVKAMDWVAPFIARAAQPAPAAKVEPASLEKYVGRYRTVWGDTQLLILDGELVEIAPNLADPLLEYSRLSPAGEHTFRVSTEDGYSDHGELVRFELDAQGRAVRMITGGGPAERVEEW